MYLNPLEGNQLKDPFLEGAEIPAVRFACHESYMYHRVHTLGTHVGYGWVCIKPRKGTPYPGKKYRSQCSFYEWVKLRVQNFNLPFIIMKFVVNEKREK